MGRDASSRSSAFDLKEEKGQSIDWVLLSILILLGVLSES